MPRSLAELIAQADALADQFEAWDPDRASEVCEPPLAALRRAAYRRVLAERDVAAAVAAARAAGESWAAVGKAVGTSGEAARQRYAVGPSGCG